MDFHVHFIDNLSVLLVSPVPSILLLSICLFLLASGNAPDFGSNVLLALFNLPLELVLLLSVP